MGAPWAAFRWSVDFALYPGVCALGPDCATVGCCPDPGLLSVWLIYLSPWGVSVIIKVPVKRLFLRTAPKGRVPGFLWLPWTSWEVSQVHGSEVWHRLSAPRRLRGAAGRHRGSASHQSDRWPERVPNHGSRARGIHTLARRGSAPSQVSGGGRAQGPFAQRAPVKPQRCSHWLRKSHRVAGPPL